MTFVAATQSTDLDRSDNITPLVQRAAQYRAERPALRDMRELCLVTMAKLGSDSATVELVARHEARIRALVSKYRTGNAPDPDRQQAALVGFLDAIHADNNSGQAGFFTLAHRKITDQLREANAAYSDRPAERHADARYWLAMNACDGDAVKARRYSGLMRLSTNDLEDLADGDTLAREILDNRIDRYDAMMRRDPDSTPDWSDYAAQTGRGLDGPTFDAIHSGVTYLDASAELNDGEGDTAYDVTTDPRATDPFAALDDEIALTQMLATLEGREREIMMRHLSGETDREIADALDISRPRVVNIRKAIVKRFRKLAEG